MSSYSPFSKSELLPQEEMLEISHKKGELLIGIPKETSYQEKRVCLTPDSVAALIIDGHRVIVESNAGMQANYTDHEYSEVGAEITNDTKKVFECPLIFKVEPPTLEEIEHIKPNTILVSALQIKTQCKEYFDELSKKKITALAFEFIKDNSGAFPAVRAFSEIAGTASTLIASELMNSKNGGNGVLFGNISGVQPAEVVVIGSGTVAEYAVRSAIGLGASVKVFDNSISKLRKLKLNINNNNIYTSTIQPKLLGKALKRCDVAISAVRGSNRAPILVTEEMVENMKNGAIIIDVSIDTGGNFETSEITTHEHPTFEKCGVLHYCVPNIASLYSRTASISISNILLPYILKIADQGGLENAIRSDRGLKNGLYFYHGVLTSKSVSNWFDIPYKDANLLIF